jgi:hypothetical protein
LIILIVLGEEYLLWSSSLCSFLQWAIIKKSEEVLIDGKMMLGLEVKARKTKCILMYSKKNAWKVAIQSEISKLDESVLFSEERLNSEESAPCRKICVEFRTMKWREYYIN